MPLFDSTPAPAQSSQNVVRETPDFRRIRDLPRRVWQQDPENEELVQLFTEQLSVPGSAARLRPIQAATLRDIHDMRGAFVTARVGAGKTIIGALAATVAETSPAIYITKAGILPDTRKAVYAASKDWRIAPLTIESYTRLSRDYDDLILGRLQPKIIICDESDALQSTKSGCWKIISEYVYGKRKEEKLQGLPHGSLCIFVAMCGTPTDQSINQYWHIVRLALGPDRSPLPRDYNEKNQWAWAMDAKVQDAARWAPGALPRLDLDAQGDDELQRARRAFGSRFSCTRGVVTTGDARPPNELHIHAVELSAPDTLRQLVIDMRTSWCTPDGHPFDYPLDLWRHARELQCGFYNVWDPRPPAYWLDARKDWHQFRDGFLKESKKYRTPGHLVKAILAGDVDDDGTWLRWCEARERKDAKGHLAFKPNPVPVWVDECTVDFCAQWIERTNGLVWTEFTAFGDRLAKKTGIPYYRQGTMDPQGRRLGDHKAGYPAIASVSACKAGLNLQRTFHANFYASPMSTNSAWEQSLGRTHRDGQIQPVVTAEVGMMVREAYSSMMHAIEKAEMVQSTMRQAQKLAYADVRDLGAVERLISAGKDAAWTVEFQAF